MFRSPLMVSGAASGGSRGHAGRGGGASVSAVPSSVAWSARRQTQSPMADSPLGAKVFSPEAEDAEACRHGTRQFYRHRPDVEDTLSFVRGAPMPLCVQESFAASVGGPHSWQREVEALVGKSAEPPSEDGEPQARGGRHRWTRDDEEAEAPQQDGRADRQYGRQSTPFRRRVPGGVAFPTTSFAVRANGGDCDGDGKREADTDSPDHNAGLELQRRMWDSLAKLQEKAAEMDKQVAEDMERDHQALSEELTMLIAGLYQRSVGLSERMLAEGQRIDDVLQRVKVVLTDRTHDLCGEELEELLADASELNLSPEHTVHVEKVERLLANIRNLEQTLTEAAKNEDWGLLTKQFGTNLFKRIRAKSKAAKDAVDFCVQHAKKEEEEKQKKEQAGADTESSGADSTGGAERGSGAGTGAGAGGGDVARLAEVPEAPHTGETPAPQRHAHNLLQEASATIRDLQDIGISDAPRAAQVQEILAQSTDMLHRGLGNAVPHIPLHNLALQMCDVVAQSRNTAGEAVGAGVAVKYVVEGVAGLLNRLGLSRRTEDDKPLNETRATALASSVAVFMRSFLDRCPRVAPDCTGSQLFRACLMLFCPLTMPGLDVYHMDEKNQFAAESGCGRGHARKTQLFMTVFGVLTSFSGDPWFKLEHVWTWFARLIVECKRAPLDTSKTLSIHVCVACTALLRACGNALLYRYPTFTDVLGVLAQDVVAHCTDCESKNKLLELLVPVVGSDTVSGGDMFPTPFHMKTQHLALHVVRARMAVGTYMRIRNEAAALPQESTDMAQQVMEIRGYFTGAFNRLTPTPTAVSTVSQQLANAFAAQHVTNDVRLLRSAMCQLIEESMNHLMGEQFDSREDSPFLAQVVCSITRGIEPLRRLFRAAMFQRCPFTIPFEFLLDPETVAAIKQDRTAGTRLYHELMGREPGESTDDYMVRMVKVVHFMGAIVVCGNASDGRREDATAAAAAEKAKPFTLDDGWTWLAAMLNSFSAGAEDGPIELPAAMLLGFLEMTHETLLNVYGMAFLQLVLTVRTVVLPRVTTETVRLRAKRDQLQNLVDQIITNNQHLLT